MKEGVTHCDFTEKEMTNGLGRPMQQQNLPRSQSTTPSTARKNAPSPTPNFDARKLRNGNQKSYMFAESVLPQRTQFSKVLTSKENGSVSLYY